MTRNFVIMIDQLKIEPMASKKQHHLARDGGVFECEEQGRRPRRIFGRSMCAT